MTYSNGIALCMGTRPEIIKMAPVYAALRNRGMNALVVHSGQHEELAWPLYDFFEMQPTETIQLKRKGQSLAHLNSILLEKLSDTFERLAPSAVLVHGDTSSALMGALAAFYLQIPVGHVEAGLRTYYQYDPFPEEKNRDLIGRIANWHFAPTKIAAANLQQEFVQGEISILGNTAIDAAQWGVSHLQKYGDSHPEFLPAEFAEISKQCVDKKLLLITAHRRENWETGIHDIANAIKKWLIENEDYVAVWPVHANPFVSQVVYKAFADSMDVLGNRIVLCKPLEYPALLWVLQRAWLVLTDSGGIQEEATALDKPVLVLRQTTERPEIIHCGRGILVGAATDTILDHLKRLHSDMVSYQRMLCSPNPFGDGTTAQQIAEILNNWIFPAVSTQDQDELCLSIA